MSAYNQNNGNLAKYAFNMYGVLQPSSFDSSINGPGQPFVMGQHSISPTSSFSSNRSKNSDLRGPRLQYQFEREITTLSQMIYPMKNLGTGSEDEINSSLVVGGRNCLRLLGLNEDQTKLVHDINILEQHPVTSASKLNNVNTIKCQSDLIACGLTTGPIVIYKLHPSGMSTLLHKFTDHTRCINSIDFLRQEGDQQIISGSQDGSIKLWDIRVGVSKPQMSVSSNTHADPIRSCQYSPHSMVRNKLTVLSVHDSGALCKYDLRSTGGNSNFTHNGSSNSHFQPERKWNLHTGPALSLHIHPEKEYVLTGGRDQKMCVWNYGQSAVSSHKITPEYMINTYGPVMKVRWSNYPNIPTTAYGGTETVDTYSNLEFEKSYDEREAVFAATASANNSLYNYDFAASYLNDDSTITVHNLSRKYVPIEIIRSNGGKPFQNFIWGKNNNSSRKIWSVTKSNVFTSHDLDGLDGAMDPYISRPLDDLSTVAFDWNNGVGDFCFVNQERYEFEVNDNGSDGEENAASSEVFDDVDSRSLELSSSTDKKLVGSIPIASNVGVHPVFSQPPIPVTPLQTTSFPGSYTTSLTASPIEKPPMFRSSTHNPMQIGKSPSPVLQHRTTSPFNTIMASERPKLIRNASTTTQDSIASVVPNSQTTSKNKFVQVNYASPYLVPLKLPLPLNDEMVFEILANNYLIRIPDGFSLIDVCLMNASVSASVSNFRDCQVWRVLAVSLQEDSFEPAHGDSDEALPHSSVDDETKSMMSDLGQFVGSFNSNSTSTTNYGNAANSGNGSSFGHSGSNSNLHGEESPLSISPETRKITENKSTTNLMDMINQSRGNSFSNLNRLKLKKKPAGEFEIGTGREPETSLEPQRAEDIANEVDKAKELENESAIMDDDEPKKLKHFSTKSRSSSNRFRRQSSNDLERPSSPIRIRSPETDVANSAFSYQKRSIRISGTSNSEDLDDENYQLLNGNGTDPNQHVASYYPYSQSSSVHHMPPSFASESPMSRRNSSLHGYQKFRHSTQQVSTLYRVESESKQEPQEEHKSELSKAIEQDKTKTNPIKPWKTQNILKKTLEYASAQGDIIMCSTLTLLFYEFFLSSSAKKSSLDWLALYVDILHKKRLFVTAANVINMAPRDILDRLKDLSKEVDLRFYCCWCQKLLINERSKMKINETEKVSEGETSFGYWYCDECSRQQSNCVYCDEPCKGLTVVVSLKCGHRGHFGCLKEWFIVEENVECPGGCDYSVI